MNTCSIVKRDICYTDKKENTCCKVSYPVLFLRFEVRHMNLEQPSPETVKTLWSLKSCNCNMFCQKEIVYWLSKKWCVMNTYFCLGMVERINTDAHFLSFLNIFLKIVFSRTVHLETDDELWRTSEYCCDEETACPLVYVWAASIDTRQNLT